MNPCVSVISPYFFLWSPEGAEEQVEHDEAELEAGDNVEASGELILSSSQLHSSH